MINLNEEIYDDYSGKILARLINFNKIDKNYFISNEDEELQCGVGIQHDVVRSVSRHYHLPNRRNIESTTEFLVVLEGAISFEIYNEKKDLIKKGNLAKNMAIIQFSGGHSFLINPGTIYFEIKQGPYVDSFYDKRLF